jgi:hypothetical protein
MWSDVTPSDRALWDLESVLSEGTGAKGAEIAEAIANLIDAKIQEKIESCGEDS